MDDLSIKLPAGLVQQALALRIDIVALCSGALRAEIERRTNVPPKKADAPRIGRPPGKTREKRTINLTPQLWAWLESKRLENETFNDTCNRVLDAARQLLP